jgi:hypothetical protein
MEFTGTVKSISEGANHVFISIDNQDGSEIRLTLKEDDPRVTTFRFRQQVSVNLTAKE